MIIGWHCAHFSLITPPPHTSIIHRDFEKDVQKIRLTIDKVIPTVMLDLGKLGLMPNPSYPVYFGNFSSIVFQCTD